MQTGSEAEARGTRRTLARVLETCCASPTR